VKYVVAGALAILAVVLGTIGLLGPRGPAAKVTRTLARYSPPDVTLVNQDGAKVRLPELLTSDRPVFLHFIYTTCTTISPVLSAAFAGFQREISPGPGAVRLVSVTIDPEIDSPATLKKYLELYRAAAGWDALTGSREDIDSVMKAFDAYMPDKASDYPVTFLRGAGNGPWVRLQGLAGKAELLGEWRQLAGANRGLTRTR